MRAITSVALVDFSKWSLSRDIELAPSLSRSPSIPPDSWTNDARGKLKLT